MLTAEELRLVEELASGSMARLEPAPRLGPDGARYPEAEPFLNDATDAASTLRSLADRGFLVATDERTVRVCPGCGSDRMRSRGCCVTCGSVETDSREIIEHLRCGCTRPRADFETAGGDYVCPDCDRTLDALGIDYARMGTQHVCGECGDRFDSPDPRFVCDDCESVVAPADAPAVDARTFAFAEERREWLDGQLFVKRDLAARLRGSGFLVASNATIRGRSGREYPVHLRATDDLLGIDLAVSVAGRLSDDGLIRLQMLREDAGVHPVLVALGEADDDESLSLLADQFGVAVVRPGDLAEAGSGPAGEPSDRAERPIESLRQSSAD